MSSSGASNGTFSAGSSLTCVRVFSRSARRCSAGTSAPPKRWRPHSVIGCSGVFCRSCEQLHSTQVCGNSRSRRVKLLDQPRLTEPRLADDRTNCPSPCRARSQRRISMAISSSRPTSGVRWRCPARRPAPLARTSRNRVTGSGTPLRAWLPRSSATKRPATWRCTRAGDYNRTRLSQGLGSRCYVGHFAEYLSRRVDHYRPSVDSDARGERWLAGAMFLRFNSMSACCIASAARTARSASFSCAIG